MLCDICNKNPATVHLTEIVDNQTSELHLCESCARQKSAQMEQQFGLSDLLAGMVDFGKVAEEKEEASLKCPKCGLTYSDFRKIGRLGCGNCYVAFKKYLAPLLRRIHGSTSHLGKVPVNIARVSRKKLDLQEIRHRLQQAIEAEEFEEAAKLRDQIKEIEKKHLEEDNSQEKE